MIINFLWFGGLRDVYTNPSFGGVPIFELSLVILFVLGAIYWFGFKRRTVLANGERGAEALAD